MVSNSVVGIVSTFIVRVVTHRNRKLLCPSIDLDDADPESLERRKLGAHFETAFE